MQRKYWIVIIVVLFLLGGSLCCCCSIAGSLSLYVLMEESDEPLALDPPLTATPMPQIRRTPLPAGNGPGTDQRLLETEIPVRDLRDLASRFRYDGVALPLVANDTPSTLQVGEQRTFWISDDTSGTPSQFQTTATLQYITEHTYWWVEDGMHVDMDDLHRSAEVFDNQTYPTNRAFFGSEWTPGVDNDPHLSIFLGHVPGVGGYYASLHEFVKEVDAYSSEMEIFFINLKALTPGRDMFDGVLAHEFQHMIHWYQDRNEETWANEGLSELASHLNGYDPGNNYRLYLDDPDLQLTTWAHNPNDTLPHYGSSYLFMRYLLEQYGEETLKAVVAAPGNGIQGVNQGLAAEGHQATFDVVFADFVVANYLNDQTYNSQWGYQDLALPSPSPANQHRRFPTSEQAAVHQYGVDYIELSPNSPVTVEFAGDTIATVVNNQPFSGQYQWYSNRGDDSDARLTRAVDLRDVSAATLNYRTWYDIEEDWDYGYVTVSVDDGLSWEILPLAYGRTTNPSGNAYGTGYTGKSNGWLAESIDLSKFAGQEILLRFEYVTDDAVNGPGITFDDITIPEIGLSDDVETPDDAWLAEGFIRMDNLLPQRFVVQVLDLTDASAPQLQRMSLDELNRGQLQLSNPDGGRYVLMVSAAAPVTTETANYQYTITP